MNDVVSLYDGINNPLCTFLSVLAGTFSPRTRRARVRLQMLKLVKRHRPPQLRRPPPSALMGKRPRQPPSHRE